MKMTKREFHIGDVLTVVTGKLLSPTHMAGVYDILNFMSGDNLYTHQLPRVSDECKPYLLKQFPQLADVDASSVDNVNWQAWLAKQEAKFGARFMVEAMPVGEHERIGPISELAEKVHPSRIVVFKP